MANESIRGAHDQVRYIHSLYLQLRTLASRLKAVERKIAVHRSKVAAAKAKSDETKKQYTEILLKARKAEDLFDQSEENLKRRRGQLSEAKNNKEYKSLLEQIADDQVKSDALAEEVLLLTEEAEKFQPQIDVVQEEVNTAKNGLASAEKELAELKPVLLKNADGIKKELKEQIPKVYREFAGPFRRAVEAYGGEEGLAPVEVDGDYFCGSCHLQIPIRFIVNMCQGQPHICTCGRFLYLPKDFTLHND